MKSHPVAHATLPDPTPEVLAYLAKRLAVRGVELRVSPAGELQLRDPGQRLDAADRATVRHYAEPLADWLAVPPPDANKVNTIKKETTPDPAAPHCDRCGHTEFRDVPIHAGRSIRRDCARCGRLVGFPVWYGDTG